MNKLDIFGSFNSWLSQSLPIKIYDSLPKILISLASTIVIIALGFWLGNIARKMTVKILEKHSVDRSVHLFLSRSASIIIKIIFVIIALSQLGVNINSFVAAIGAAGITAGLGLKDSISQFASGIQILFNKTFQSGDFIEIDGLSGKVEEIHFMYTTLITLDNKRVTIPNNHVTSNDIVNYTAKDTRRVDFMFSISYDDDISKAKGILYRTARDNPNVLDNPAPYAAVNKHGSSSIELVLQVWCKSENYWSAYYTMQEDVKNAFDKHGINIPYDQLDIHIKNDGDK